MRVDLFVIDGQNDFCDNNGSLYVEGAGEEAKLVADMIDRLENKKSQFGHNAQFWLLTENF